MTDKWIPKNRIEYILWKSFSIYSPEQQDRIMALKEAIDEYEKKLEATKK